MALNLGPDVSNVYESLGYNFDKVVFQKGKPILDSELNLLQDIQETLTQQSTAHLPSGWLSYRPIYTSSTLSEAFYTQDPEGSKPEVALVNGWPIYVTNTRTPLTHVNKIDLSQNDLRSGSRVDGVFLEVWRSLIIPNDDTNKPIAITKMSDIRGVYMYDENRGWAVGDNNVILRTLNGGTTWVSLEAPVSGIYNKIRFYNKDLGYIVGNSGVVLKTSNSGDSWIVSYNDIIDNLNDISVASVNHVCVVGDNGTILLSTDGSLFNLISSTDGTTDNLKGVYFVDTYVGWAVGDNGTLLLTKDGGLSWERQLVFDSRLRTQITTNFTSVAFYTSNNGIIVGDNGLVLRSSDGGYTWTNVSDRIWYNSAYTDISTVYPNETNKFNKVFIRKEFPIQFTISIYPDFVNYFTNMVYKISPAEYPDYLVFEFKGTLDNQNYRQMLNLNAYSTAEELRDAINAILNPYLREDILLPTDDRQKVRVFSSSITYVPVSPSSIQSTVGYISGSSPAELSFSVEDKAWIVGTNGILLKSDNSGAKWTSVDTGVATDFYDTGFVTNTLGWLVGSDGTVGNYNSENSPSYVVQETDLVLKNKGRIYPEGNVESEAEDYLEDNLINPQVGVETTKRVQIQYRIRVVDGVDPFTYPESGLGSNYVYSLGPNDTNSDAGTYTFANSGTENGDYGVWKARCRNTVDGYCWAIPMFFVSRRNSSPFNITSNINGSTYYNLGAVRPDGLLYENIVENDIIDLRRKINIQSYSNLMEKGLDNLFTNTLDTNINNRDERGDQYGTSLLAVDIYTGTTAITNLLTGGVNAEAIIVEQTKDVAADPTPTELELTFGPIDKSLYHNDPAYYTAQAIRTISGTETILENVPGTWTGLGTNKVVFTIDINYVPTGGTDDVTYRLVAHYMDYSRTGLGRIPEDPIGIKYIPDNINNTLFYRGIDKNVKSKVIEYLTERVSGYPDYTDIYAPMEILNSDDLDTYQYATTEAETSSDFIRSNSKFRGQQLRGSLVYYHYFLKTTEPTSVIRIAKNLEGYGVFAVKSITNVNGSVYRIDSIASRETVNSVDINTNLIINLNEAYIIPSGSTVEITLEVVSLGGANSEETNLGLTDLNSGENQDALRVPFVSSYGVNSKAIRGFYKCVMFPIEIIISPTNTLTIDLTKLKIYQPEDTRNGIVLGISSYSTRTSNNQMFLWYKESDADPALYKTIPISSVDNIGTSTITIHVDPSYTLLLGGYVFVPILIQQISLPALGTSDTFTANVFYKYTPYQTVKNLPSEMLVDVVKCSEFVYVSNMGTGSSSVIKPEPYETPIEHIPVNDSTFLNDNIFSNVDDLNFSNYTVDTGFIKLPGIISRVFNGDVLLSSPNNVGDNLGRTFYTKSSVDMVLQAESLSLSTPRKVFVPMLARVRSDINTPFLRGELVLIIFSKVYKARTENKTGYFEDDNTEYKRGYYEEANTAIGMYHLKNKPLVRF
jgi:photosystem II stability/assembly factor-like uncharacterized protein